MNWRRTLSRRRGGDLKLRIALVPLLAMAAVAGSACGGASQPAAASKPVVGLVMKSLANPYFKAMADAATAHAAERGDLKLIPVGMHSETDIDTQITEMETFITQKVNAIVLAPADSKALVPEVVKALHAGIKVVNIDVRLDPDALKQAGIDLAYVGPDNRDAAKMSGDVLAKALGPGGKVVILEGISGADNATQRKLGFDDAVTNGNLKLLASQTANWETELANTVFTNLLTAHPDIQGAMASNDSMGLGVVKAIQAAGKTNSIKVVSFDDISAMRPNLQSGLVLATLEQYPGKQASLAVDYALQEIKGGAAPTGWIKTPVDVVTTANMASITPTG